MTINFEAIVLTNSIGLNFIINCFNFFEKKT